MTFIFKKWNAFWFEPAPLLNLAICRIVLVALQLWILVVWRRYHEILSQLSEIPDSLYDPLLVVRILTFPFGPEFRPSLEVTEIIYALTVGIGIFALIGLKTNVSLSLFTLGSVFLTAYKYSFSEIHHPETLMMLALTIMSISPAGAVLSVDDLRRRLRLASKNQAFSPFQISEEQSPFARWPILLMIALLGLAYLSGFYYKLLHSGLDWANGYTLQWNLLRDDLRSGRENGIGMWLAQFHTFVSLLSYSVLAFQATFLLVLVFPLLSYVYFPMGIAFHAGIFLILGADFFEWLILYVCFVPWAQAGHRLKTKLGWRKPTNKLEVLFDVQCPLCIRSMTLVRYFDWLDGIVYSDVTKRWATLGPKNPGISLDDCLKEMYLLLPDGSVKKGYFAFREMLWRLPLLWPIALLFYLPGASILGPQIYHYVASHRFRFTRCTSDACAFHTEQKSDAN